LLYANRNNEIVFKTELEKISKKHPEFTIQYFIGDNKITRSSIKPLISSFQLPTFYISGPESMMKSFVNLLKEQGVAEENIKHDFFPGYLEI
jgi:ferredoxin-NADP reductase